VTTIASPPLPVVTTRRRTKFFIGLAVAMLTLVVVGFARTFYLRPLFGAIDGPTRSPELPWHLLVHGLVMTSWFALVVAQTLLIVNRNTALHRRIGIAGAALAALVVVASMFTVVEFVVRREAVGMAITEQQQPVVIGDTLNMLVYFPLFVAGALYFRGKPEAHKRLMLVSCVVMLDPVAARFFTLFSIAGLRDYAAVLRAPVPLLALALLAYDLASRKRPHWATVCGLVWVALSRGPFSRWLYFNPAADAYVDWLRHLR
jgi:hypothetical protein